MRLTPLLLLPMLALAPLLPASAQAAGEVKLSFVAPEKFSDIGTGTVERERVLRSLGDFLSSLGAKALADGQTLELTITDIDLAGENRLTPRGDVRVLRGGADWPKIELRYALRAGEKVLKSGEARLSDSTYLSGRRTLDLNTEHGHEKRMLRTWFTETFGAP